MDRTSGSAAIRPWRNFRSERYRACQDFATVLVDQDVLLETHAHEPAQSVNAIPVDVVAITLSRQQCFDEVKARLDRPGLARFSWISTRRFGSSGVGCRTSWDAGPVSRMPRPTRWPTPCGKNSLAAPLSISVSGALPSPRGAVGGTAQSSRGRAGDGHWAKVSRTLVRRGRAVVARPETGLGSPRPRTDASTANPLGRPRRAAWPPPTPSRGGVKNDCQAQFPSL